MTESNKLIDDFSKVIKLRSGMFSFNGMTIPNDKNAEQKNPYYREIEEYLLNNGEIQEEPAINIKEYQKDAINKISLLIDEAHNFFLEGASLSQQLRYKIKAEMAEMILNASKNNTLGQLRKEKADVVYAFQVEANLEKTTIVDLAQRVYTKYSFLTYKIIPLLETFRRSLTHEIEVADTKEKVDLVWQKAMYIKENILQTILIELKKGTDVISLFDQCNKLFNS